MMIVMIVFWLSQLRGKAKRLEELPECTARPKWVNNIQENAVILLGALQRLPRLCRLNCKLCLAKRKP